MIYFDAKLCLIARGCASLDFFCACTAFRHVIARIAAVNLYIAYVIAVPQCGVMALAQATFERPSQILRNGTRQLDR